MSDTTTTNAGRDPNASRKWMRKVQDQQRRCEEENGVLRNLYKQAKADGEDPPTMRRAIRATKLTPEEAVTNTRNLVYYMALRNIPVTQDALFGDLDVGVTDSVKHADDRWDAEDKGYRAGRMGLKIEDCPYTAGTEFFVAWEEHWRKGQASIAREMAPDEKLADASRARPKRARQMEMPGTEIPKEPRKKAARKKAARRKSAGRRRANGPTTAGDGVPVY
jgi:ribosome modulation factor